MGKKYKSRVICPFPGCQHVGLLITKVHCRNVHGMERDELFKKYGNPKAVEFDPHKLRENLKPPAPY